MYAVHLSVRNPYAVHHYTECAKHKLGSMVEKGTDVKLESFTR